MVSLERKQSLNLWATRISNWSPRKCPRLSLTTLNWSRSINRTANTCSARRLVCSIACPRRSRNKVRFASPVIASCRALYDNCLSTRSRSAISFCNSRFAFPNSIVWVCKLPSVFFNWPCKRLFTDRVIICRTITRPMTHPTPRDNDTKFIGREVSPPCMSRTNAPMNQKNGK